MTTSTKNIKNFLIRIPEGLRKELKVKAAQLDLPMNSIILDLIASFVKGAK